MAAMFEQIPVELWGDHLAPALDPPSLLSFSLISTSFYHHFYPKIIYTMFPSFDNWLFMDECARRGYRELMHYAVDNGALVDLAVLHEAIDCQQLQICRFLYHRNEEEGEEEGESVSNGKKEGKGRRKRIMMISELMRTKLWERAARTGNLQLLEIFASEEPNVLEVIPLFLLLLLISSFFHLKPS